MTLITAVVVLVFVSLTNSVNCENLPSFIKPCSKTSNLTSCLIENIMSSIPHIKNGQTQITQSFDPYSIPIVQMDKEWLTVKLTNVEYPIFHEWEVKSLSVDLDEGKISVTIYAGRMSGYGYHTVNGTLFGMELDAHGTAYANLAGLEISIDMKGEYTVKKGKRYLILEKTGFRQHCHSGSIYWSNLYPGEPYRTLRANHVINQNIAKFIDELDLIVDNVYGSIIFKGFKNFFEMYSVDDIFTD